MTQRELIDEVIRRNPLDSNSRAATTCTVASVFAVIKQVLAEGDSISISNFGTFKPVERKERTFKNMHDDGVVTVPAHIYPAFKPSGKLKKAINDANVPEKETA